MDIEDVIYRENYQDLWMDWLWGVKDRKEWRIYQDFDLSYWKTSLVIA